MNWALLRRKTPHFSLVFRFILTDFASILQKWHYSTLECCPSQMGEVIIYSNLVDDTLISALTTNISEYSFKFCHNWVRRATISRKR